MDQNTNKSQIEGLDVNKGNNSSKLDFKSHRKTKSLMDQSETQKRVFEHQQKVNQIVSQLCQLLEQDPIIELCLAQYLLRDLRDILEVEELAYIKTQFLEKVVLKLRNKLVDNQEIENMVQFQLVTYYADTILRFINNNHKFKYTTQDLMINLTQEQVLMSRDFLIRNCKGNEIWCRAVAQQGLQLVWDEQLMQIMLDLIDQPYAYNVFAIQIYMPFYQNVCDMAWNLKNYHEVMLFIIQEIMKGEKYFDAFLQYGIYDAFKVFITEALLIPDLIYKVESLQFILEALKFVWSHHDIFSDIKYTYQSRIYDYIAEIPVNLINSQSLNIIFWLIHKINTNSKYDLNFIILNFTWYQKLNKILLYYKYNELVNKITILQLGQICKGSLSLEASEAITVIISEYQEAKKQQILQDQQS